MINESMLRFADTGFALRFLRLLTMPVEKTAAFKTGVIDKEYKVIKKPETSAEKNSYTIFHRLVFNLRKLLRKVPIVGKLTVSSYLAALWLIKEHTGLSEDEMSEALLEAGLDCKELTLVENKMFINNDGYLLEGCYTLNKNLLLPITAEELILKGSQVVAEEDCKACGTIFETSVFKVYHPKTKNYIYITQEDIEDA